MSDNLNRRIPEEIAPEVFALASRLYAQASQSYSVKELMQAGAEVRIPPEFIQQAVQEVEAKRRQTQKRRKTLLMIGGSVAAIVTVWGIWTYNSLSRAAQSVDAAWAQVENQFQRRADLIPSLVNVTQTYATHERELATILTQSRTNYLQANTQAEKITAMAQVSQAIHSFREYAAVNPQLQSERAFTNLQYELVGTENRIAVERMRYNQAVQAYNQQVQAFPNLVLAQTVGFQPKPFFQANSNSGALSR